MTVKLLFLAGLGLVQLFLIRLALPLARRAVPPNATYGLRTAATRADPVVWYEANARTARESIRTAVGVWLVAAGLLAVPPLTPITYGAVCLVLWLLSLVAGALWGARVARQLARERSQPRAPEARGLT